jgi:cell division protein FtsW
VRPGERFRERNRTGGRSATSASAGRAARSTGSTDPATAGALLDGHSGDPVAPRRRTLAWWGRRSAPKVERVHSTGFVGILAVVGVLNAVGLVFVLSSSSVEALEDHGSSWYFFSRQVTWAGGGIFALVVMSRIHYRRLRRVSGLGMLVSMVLLAAVLMPGGGVTINGARRWLGIGPFTVQPSELAKLALIIFLADLLARREHVVGEWRRGALPCLIGFGSIVFFVMLQPDLGTTVATGIIFLTMLLIGGARFRHIAGIALVGIGGVALAMLSISWRRARFFVFLDPWKDPTNTGYQISQSLIGTGSGGATGTGLGAGRAKWSFLPNAHNDFIFAIIAEETGFVGCLAILGLFGTFGVLGIRASLKAPDRFGMLLATGITSWVLGQAVINIATVIGLMPATGIPLPFISFGGTALMIMMAATGVLLSVARQARP